jgi:hypothetical protein
MQFLSQKLSLKKLVKNHGRKLLNVLVFFAMVAIGFLGFWFAFKVILNTEYPVLPVSSSNMCVAKVNCNGFVHPFEHTLHVGDLVIVQGVNSSTVRVAYPNSDILVFHFPKSGSYDSDGLVITRAVAKEERNGIIYFRTKGDGVGIHVWPEMSSVSECDWWYDFGENYTWNGMISEKLVVGKVVFRVPWIGYIVLFVQNPFGIFITVMILIIVLLAKFAISKFTSKKAEIESKKV